MNEISLKFIYKYRIEFHGEGDLSNLRNFVKFKMAFFLSKTGCKFYFKKTAELTPNQGDILDFNIWNYISIHVIKLQCIRQPSQENQTFFMIPKIFSLQCPTLYHIKPYEQLPSRESPISDFQLIRFPSPYPITGSLCPNS